MRNRIFVAIGLIAIVLPLYASGAGGDGVGPDPFIILNRWASTATDGSGLGQGDPTTLTWSLLPDGTNISGGVGEPASASNLISFLDTYIGAGPGGTDLTLRPWFPIFNNSFNRMSELSGLTEVYEPNDDGNTFGGIDGTSPPYGQLGVRGDVRIGGHSIDGQSGSNTLAYNYYLDHGDMVIDTDNIAFYSNSAGDYLRFRNTVMHEHGHGVGLRHVESSSSGFLMEPYISTAFDGPQLDDVLGLHRNYGDVNEKSSGGAGNDTAADATSLGTVGLGESLTIGEDAADTVVAATDVDFVSIDDNSDLDYFSFSVDSNAVVDLVLTPLGPTYQVGPQGGTQAPFDSSALSDLTLEILDTDGSSLLGFANDAGIGSSESLASVLLDAAGTYFVKVSGAQNDVQLYQLDLSVSVVPEPATLVMLAIGLMAFAVWTRRRQRAAT